MPADNSNREYEALFRPNSPSAPPAAGRVAKDRDAEKELAEGSCPAFGFLRGLSARALAIEFRFRGGDSHCYSYGLLAWFKHHPGVGLLLKFTGGDAVTLVLVRGSNLDAGVEQHAINLTDRGLQRHRITYIREMDEEELRRVGNSGPTVDGIEVGEFETAEEQRDWLKKTAPEFLQK